ncbi:hypothetical protein CBE01nite_42990 [Clostridium beijerinckii]|uniref:Diguanylate cyclase n=1 Tax=Clostridium beijerinckii TaxID=1520 RepID=A0AB74V9G6_CLOBE|nr:sensor domain-containing diguanylate cyclase [Clostridium beijerinckii]NRZ27213.1 diguanylate cyclase (GGDEF)-like protein/PAS domain S-box-containing protein [Clostridium beijerinckii]NYB96991.1 diguanylate cyclase (GGDEF)-like protein/PAS domain S-box-containing protein [Clostridium beijerinckii]OOM19363.1 putative diguanylate cyclase YdaM [Clostridium beijerinckii]QUN33077.1 diguanylate cyclase [Clostridium beijerinckii]SQB21043.1 PAS domain S-box/diguanylate cyclase (GGDEF) domain-conta
MLDKDLNIYNDLDLFMEIFNSISDLVFFIKIDNENIFRYLFINKQAKKYIHLKESPIGKTIYEIMPKNVADLITKQYKEAINKKACVTYEDNLVKWYTNLEEFPYSSSEFKHFETKVTPILNNNSECTHIIAIVRDITDRKLAEQALKESEEKYRLIADNMTDLISIIDTNGFIKYVSPSYEFVLGYPIDTYIGKSILDFVYFDEVENIKEKFFDLIKNKNVATVEFRHKHVNGNWVWVEAKASAVLDEHKNVSHVLMLARDITKRKLLEKKLKHMAYHDTLTGLPNRRLFKANLLQALNEKERLGQDICVMFMDIDKFKIVNDTLGHDIGDELLCQFSQRVKECLRKNDILARFGGDEFCALLLISERENAENIAKRILKALQDKWLIGEYEFFTTSSIGIAFYENGLDDDTLIKNADIALYKAKEKGRNNYKIFYNSIK